MGEPLQAIQLLLQQTAYSSLKWKVVLSHDLNRLHSFTSVPYQDLSEEGKQQADSAGYTNGDTITFQILAERKGSGSRLFSNGAKMLLALVGEIAKEFQMHRFEGLEEIRKRIQALS